MMSTSTRFSKYRLSTPVCACTLIAMTMSAFGAQLPDSQPNGANTQGSRVEDQVQLLRAEVDALRAEVKSLRDAMQSQLPVTQLASSTTANSQSSSVPPQTDGAGPQSAATPQVKTPSPDGASVNANPQQTVNTDQTSMLQSQVSELAQTKVESSSKWPVKIYGTILSTTFYNTRNVDWADTPNLVNPAPAGIKTGWFSSSLRQSRIGLSVDGPTLGSFRTSGVFAIDFAGGSNDFQATPLFGLANIVYAYARFQNARTTFEAGQDEMILGPRSPTSLVALSYPELYRAGNLYARAPQLRVEHHLGGLDAGQQFKFTVGLVAPVSTYPTLDFPGGSISNGWRKPAVQARLSWASAPPTSVEKAGWEVGVSGHYGQITLPLVGTSGNQLSAFSAASWAGAFDFDAHYRAVGFDAEGYIGRNLQSLGAGIGQPGKTMGGYFEGRLQPTQRLRFNLGLGDDHLTKPESRIAVDLKRNTGAFANTIFQFTPEVGISFEYRYMVTRPFTGPMRQNNNLNLGIAYSF